jgi:hypothetical protein
MFPNRESSLLFSDSNLNEMRHATESKIFDEKRLFEEEVGGALAA